jgi:TonB-linked SusC/RagA family outer membrane protein
MRYKLGLLVALLLGIASSDALAQVRTITGRVTDQATGAPLPGANVEVLGSGTGTLANADGSFSIQVPMGEVTLRVSLIGYARRDVVVPAGQNAVQIALGADVLRLDEIVVTGQATGISRRNLANAVATVNAQDLNVAPAASIESQLAGKIAGVDIQSNSGAPGGGNQVNLRGVTTIIGNATPLYVIDGVIVSDVTIPSGANSVTGAGGGMASNQDNSPNRIADLNPADIESIEILKGASAAAIYGSKANNGVIMIKTKRGQAGKPRYTLSQRFGVSRLSNKLGTRRWTLDNAIARYGNNVGGVPITDFFNADGTPKGVYDLEEQLAGGNHPSYETALSVSGGSDDTRYYASGLYKSDEGIVLGTYYDKYSIKLNLDQRLGDRLSLGLSTNALHTKTGRGFTNNDNSSTTYYMTWTGTPSFVDLRRRPDGTYPENPFQVSNPLQTAALARNDESVYRFIGAFNVTLDALNRGGHDLRFLVNGGADFFNQKNIIYSPEDLQYEPTDGFAGLTLLGTTYNTNLNINANAVHTYTPSSAAFTATTSIGVQYEYWDQDVTRALTEDLFAGQRNVGSGTRNQVEEARSRSKDLGVFAQEEFLWNDRLLLTFGMRAERSSNNAFVDEWYYYPKAAASYRFTELMPGLVEEVKLRGAWGQSGNQPRYGQKFINLNPGSIAGVQTLLLGTTTVAQDLRPERQTEIEGGFDAYFFNNRASIEFTAYQRKFDDLLLNRALPPSTGYTTALYNMGGQMTVTGQEVAAMVIPVQTENFSWTSRATFSRDRSVIDSLDVAPFNAPNAGFGTSLGAVQIAQGKSVTQIVGRAIIKKEDDPRCLEALGVEKGSGRCTPGTTIVTQIGDANPDFRMGFVNEFRYKALRVASTVDWQHGGDIVNLTGYLLDASRNSADFDAPCKASDCLEGETLGQYRLRLYPSRTTELWVEDGSYVKLREVALSLQVPTSFLASTPLRGINGMVVTLAGRNLLTFTNYTGLDPEVNNFGSQAIRANIDVAPYPPSRSFWLSVDVSF